MNGCGNLAGNELFLEHENRFLSYIFAPCRPCRYTVDAIGGATWRQRRFLTTCSTSVRTIEFLRNFNFARTSTCVLRWRRTREKIVIKRAFGAGAGRVPFYYRGGIERKERWTILLDLTIRKLFISLSIGAGWHKAGGIHGICLPCDFSSER